MRISYLALIGALSVIAAMVVDESNAAATIGSRRAEPGLSYQVPHNRLLDATAVSARNAPLHVIAGDTDGDGCTDVQEDGSSAAFGGDRDANVYWDFYDVTDDRRIDLGDTLLILDHFGHAVGDDPTDAALDRYNPNPAKPYRTAQAIDGAGVDLTDALVNLESFGHDCTDDCIPDGGPLQNGALRCGRITAVQEVDTWSFEASAGDRIGVEMGEIIDLNGQFAPWIRMIAPNASEAFCGPNTPPTFTCSSDSLAAAALEGVAPVTGTYLVLVASKDTGFDGAGTYRLTMTHTPGPITVSDGDEGGALTNGALHTGTILTGDLDVWTFNATAGDRIAVEAGEVTDSNGFAPWIRMWAPTGSDAFCGPNTPPTFTCSSDSLAAAALEGVAPVTGTYLVLVASKDTGFDGAGTYRLTMTHTPGPITVTDGDEGGALTNGALHTGTILTGDLDVWTFNATAGATIGVNVNETADINGFAPWIRIWAPTGTDAFCGPNTPPNFDCSSNGAAGAALVGVAPVTGTYLVLVASSDTGFDGVGDYQLAVTWLP